MRRLAEAATIRRFMKALGAGVRAETRVYFTGGVSSVLMGWRAATIDVDVTFVPDRDEVLRLLPDLKNELELNIELAAPSQFVPELPGWEDRSPFIAREGLASFHHYDFYAQALSKIERGHVQDRSDVKAMLDAGLVQPVRLRELFEGIVDQLYRYPALDPATLRRALNQALAGRD
jgi:hypothetical protein